MKDAVVICTRDRPDDVRRCLESIFVQTELPSHVVVADSSVEYATEGVVRSFPGASHLRVEPGLTKQRNSAVASLPLGTEVVHFVDDDVLMDSDYLAAVKREFCDPSVVGVGGVVSNVPERKPRLLYRLFLLDSRRPGAVLRSGRNVIAAGVRQPTLVDWLSGCSMSFRIGVLLNHQFEESLTGYCFGEDVEYCLRVADQGALVVTPYARVEHRTSTINRYSALRWHSNEIVARYWRVRRFPVRMSRLAFWWSLAGQLMLPLAKSALLRQRSLLIPAYAVVAGSWTIFRRKGELVEG